MDAETPGTVNVVKALNESRGHAAAWAQASADIQQLAVIVLRRRMSNDQVAAQLDLPLADVAAVAGIDLDRWYGTDPRQAAVFFRNRTLQENGLEDFVVTETRKPQGSLQERLVDYVRKHPGVELQLLLAVFDEDARFGWNVADAVASSPNLESAGPRVYPLMHVSVIRDKVWLGTSSDEIWIAYESGWALATGAPGRNKSDVDGWRSNNPITKMAVKRELGSLQNVVACEGADGKVISLSPRKDAAGMFVVWPTIQGGPRAERSAPPGWTRDKHGIPRRAARA